MLYEVFEFLYEDSGVTQDVKIEVSRNCPICQGRSKPDVIYHSELNSDIEKSVIVVFQCQVCYRFYLYEYNVIYIPGRFLDTSRLDYPRILESDLQIPEKLDVISGRFKNIYTQAEHAEKTGLDELAGTGYRKAVEFLVKDFLIKHEGKEEDKINKLPLSQAIDKISFERIKSTAKAATWIGNDEIHYVKKFENKDISHLKEFIASLVFFISAELSADEAMNFINGDE